MYIKPAMVRTQDGFVLANVYDPDRRDRIPPEGRDVPETGYWIRRLMEGGVVRADDPDFTKEMKTVAPEESDIEEPKE